MESLTGLSGLEGARWGEVVPGDVMVRANSCLGNSKWCVGWNLSMQGRAAMGDEVGKKVGIGIMKGPECQVRSLGCLLQTGKWKEKKGTPLGRPWLAAGD